MNDNKIIGKFNFKKDIVFLVIMFFLIFLFSYGFIKNVNGNQGNVYFAHTRNYMADYYNVAKYSAAKSPYLDETNGAAEHAYPPLAYILGYLWSKGADYLNYSAMEAGRSNLGLATSAFFMFFVSSFYLLLFYDAVKKQKLYKILITTCMILSGIFLFSYERGNSILIAALFSSFFVLNYNHKDKVIVEISYFALAIAAALKGYPALLGILLFFDKNYKGAIRLIIYGILFTFLPFLFLEGGFNNLPILLKNVKLNSNSYALRVFPRFNFRFWTAQISNAELKTQIYSIMEKINLLLCCTAVIASFFQKVPWKRIMILLLIIVVFPVNSAAYTGLYLLVGMIMFLNEEHTSFLDWFYLLFIVLILNPFQIVVNEYNYTTLAMNLSASAMLILLTIETFWQIKKSKSLQKIKMKVLNKYTVFAAIGCLLLFEIISIQSNKTNRYYDLDTEIYFASENRDADKYIIKGLSGNEGVFSWTNGNELKMELKVNKSYQGSMLHAFFDVYRVYNNEQKIKVMLNDKLIYSTILQSGQNLEFDFMVPKNGDITLCFMLPDAISPLERGESTDARNLGLALVKAKFELLQ